MKFAVPLPTLSACAAMVLLPWTRAADKRDWIALRSVKPRRSRISVAQVGKASMTCLIAWPKSV